MTNKEKNRLSKLLSLVLRHTPEEIGLTIDRDGWANVTELLQKMDMGFEDLKEVVDTNDKKRFSFSDDFSKIRANQGHSIEANLNLEPTTPPEILFHGTAEKNIASILEKGLLKQDRNYVHLSADIDTAKKVGTRYGKPIILKISALKMQQEGYLFYISKNGVWLTDFVPDKYLKKIG
ncbi:MAG: RNA 2'-phosphotransferase [Flavobacteriales bacterium]|nr:RNA 2'-phosphotransferase [Flavobacteriales bacterium]NCP91143.1 RNA 2'-phosphotransferase [Flavobacteriales bacterium]NCQ15199.1 RNA 2'-phosphotransferase [Flavobacteriales bacterium]NCQ58747.1 RNA 2'-phosphotransferase [Flavobacteriales bacterium]NCT16100.1 RNA 2'-phosphotransferase [Flavobacteriales bacterium]